MAKTNIFLLFDTTGPEGNIFYMLNKVYNALNDDGHSELAKEVKDRVPSAANYEEAKAILAEYADITYLE